ncbi:T9SS type A sorting domain-containing protein, partial [bacterium]|nr:T9SS type A sorting domain-containing protein [bacterium]
NTEDDEYWRIQGHFGLTRQVTRAVAGALASMAGITDESLYDLSAAYAYPSPWKAAEHDAITFNGLAPGATLSVFDTTGTLVFSTTVSSYEYDWSVVNGSGKPIASGVYLFTATTTDGAIVRGKLAVIR